MIDETFLTTEEVLEYLQVNLRTVYRLIKAARFRPCASVANGDSASGTSMPGWTTNGRGVWPISRRHPHRRRRWSPGADPRRR